MYLALVISSLLVSYIIVGIIQQLFKQYVIDLPNERSSHKTPTPRGGGLGFVISFALTSLIGSLSPRYFGEVLNSSKIAFTESSFLWIVLTPLVIIGIIDDYRGLPASVRYFIHLSASGLAIAFFGTFPQPWLTNLAIAGQVSAIALTAIGITALINFYNFMDGLDGFVAGVTAVQLGFLAIYLHQPLLWLLVAALLGFLCWNWSPAKIFMGDVGSTVLGATVAIALLNTRNDDPILAWSALAITLPITGDAIYTLICRIIRRENIFKAHRTHLYQRLHQSGWPHAQVATTYILLTVLMAVIIENFRANGAWICLAIGAVAILGGELYLSIRNPHKGQNP